MADPLKALMYAVQVMNLLKNLTDKTLRERKIASPKVESSDNSSEAEDGDAEEYNQEERYTKEEEEEDENVDDVNKEEEIVKAGITLLGDEHKLSSELDTNEHMKTDVGAGKYN